MIKPITCICQRCKCCPDCGYYNESIQPVLEVVQLNAYEMSDPYIRALDEALENYTCDYFEEEST